MFSSFFYILYYSNSLTDIEYIKSLTAVTIIVNPKSIKPVLRYVLYVCGIVYGVEVGVLAYIGEKADHQTPGIELVCYQFVLLTGVGVPLGINVLWSV